MKQEMPAKRKTILMDIDGTIFYHKDNLYHMAKDVPVLLDGTIEKLLEWRAKEYYIVLTTARPEGCRAATVEQLKNAGVFYDQLVMGLPAGPRVSVCKDDRVEGAWEDLFFWYWGGACEGHG